MEVEYAFLADAAQVSEGKLYVLGGGVERLLSPQFPFAHGPMTLVVKLKLHPTECNRKHRMEVHLWDPDGARLAQINADFAVPPAAEGPLRPSMVQMVFNLVGQQYPRPGDYAFHLVVDEQHLRTVPLYVERARVPAAKDGDSTPPGQPPA